MLYTNQKTFRSLQVTPDLPTSTRDQFISVTLHSTGVTPRIAISTTTAFGNSCKTHSEAASLKYTTILYSIGYLTTQVSTHTK